MDTKNNSGSLYRNQQKAKEFSPDYSGKALVAGKEYKIAGWLNKSKTGGNYLRILFTEVVPKPQESTGAEQQRLNMGTGIKDGNIDSIMLDDLPF